MSDDYTPTTDQVCAAYVRAMRNAFIASAGEHEEEFYRWLDGVISGAYSLGIDEKVVDDEARAAAWEDGWAKGALSEKTSFGRTVSYAPKINPYVVSDLDGAAL